MSIQGSPNAALTLSLSVIAGLLALTSAFTVTASATSPNPSRSLHRFLTALASSSSTPASPSSSSNLTKNPWRTIDLRESDDACATLSPATARSWSSTAYEESCRLYDDLMSTSDDFIRPLILSALMSLDQCYRLYGPNLTLSSYNGGKDACVIMSLHRAAHANYFRARKEAPTAPRVCFFDNPKEFDEIVQLLKATVNQFDLDMMCLTNCDFSGGLDALTSAGAAPHQKNNMAFILGTRVGDPNCKDQKVFEPSSDWMPPFMRVNPVLDWTYGHIWHFLRFFDLPYCSLYDKGFTSLGNNDNTFPCPALKKHNAEGYWPAYMLTDWSRERDGRVKKEKDELMPPPPASPPQPLIGQPCSVGLLIIGDEILNGMVHDVNTFAAATSLKSVSVPLERVLIVGDDEDEIVDSIIRLSQHVDYIVTSGGVGPTHDDVTMKAVSRSLSSPLAVNMEMVDFVQAQGEAKANTSPSEATLKMCNLPSNSELLFLTGPENWPVLLCGHVFVLPGVPEFFDKKIQLVAQHLQFKKSRSKAIRVVLNAEETKIVTLLNQVVSNNPRVQIGSYPFVSNPELKTVVTLEAKSKLEPKMRRMSRDVEQIQHLENVENTSEALVSSALSELLAVLPEEMVIRVEEK